MAFSVHYLIISENSCLQSYNCSFCLLECCLPPYIVRKRILPALSGSSSCCLIARNQRQNSGNSPLTLKVSPDDWQVSPQSLPECSRPVLGSPAMRGEGGKKWDGERHRFGAKDGDDQVDHGKCRGELVRS